MINNNELIAQIKSYNKFLNTDSLNKAYNFALKAHEDQKREEGVPYIIHPVAVAKILTDLKLDSATITTGLLHDTIEDTKVTYESVKKEFEIANNRVSIIRLLGYAKSAIRHNMAEELPHFKMPVCLIWGEHDKVTPPKVAHEFHSLLPNSELHWVPLCGHAPMWEHPEEFSKIVLQWLKAKF